MKRQQDTARFLKQAATTFLSYVIPRYVRRARATSPSAIGCTGGRHRSVMIANAVAEKLARARAIPVRVRHRDLRQE